MANMSDLPFMYVNAFKLRNVKAIKAQARDVHK